MDLNDKQKNLEFTFLGILKAPKAIIFILPFGPDGVAPEKAKGKKQLKSQNRKSTKKDKLLRK